MTHYQHFFCILCFTCFSTNLFVCCNDRLISDGVLCRSLWIWFHVWRSLTKGHQW